MGISKQSIEKIKSIPPSSVLEKEGAILKKVGREFISHCLWHKDTNPSLTISDDKGFVFCHVCQHHSDAIGYVVKKNGLNFREACERISSTFNLILEYEDEDSPEYLENKKKIEALIIQTEKVQKIYRLNLKSAPECIDFIRKRKILPETSRLFQLGYNSQEKRLTVPIHNYKGQIVGFTARSIYDEVKPKYKNTETNLIFNKSEIIFNENRASQHITDLGECVIVEGHLDVVSLYQAGCKNVVALQGTAVPSRSVLERLFRKTNRFILCMDGDEGGRLAVGRFLSAVQSQALSGKIEVKVANLPSGMDPDDYINSGLSIKTLLAESSSWLDWILDSWLTTLNFESEVELQQIEKKIIDLFSQLSSPALRAHYYDKASIRLAQNKQSVAAQIAKSFHENKSRSSIAEGWNRPESSTTRYIAEKKLIRLYINRQDLRYMLKPLMAKIQHPMLKWLNTHMSELEEYSKPENLKYALAAVLSVAEPPYLSSLRSVLFPTIRIEDDADTLIFIEDTLMNGTL